VESEGSSRGIVIARRGYKEWSEREWSEREWSEREREREKQREERDVGDPPHHHQTHGQCGGK
jgi:hypothetical protein